MKLIANQQETLDGLLFRYYAQQSQRTKLVELALRLNPQLAHYPILPMGQIVEMPDDLPQQQAIKATIQLWN